MFALAGVTVLPVEETAVIAEARVAERRCRAIASRP
jgi:hypothetical protein